MDKLIKKYKNFAHPDFDIMVNGANIRDKSALVDKINVNLSTEKSSICSFVIFNAFDFKEKKIKWVDEIFALGNSLQIKLGYGDSKEDVFDGFITSINYTFEGNNRDVIVSGMDNTFKMMKGAKSFSWTEKKHSDVAKTIISNYSSESQVDSTDVTYDIIEQSRLSDYQFVKWLAKKNNYEFFSVLKKIYFRKPHKTKTPVVNIDMDIGVLRLSIEHDLVDQIVDVETRGIDITKKEQITGKSKEFTTVDDGKTGSSLIKKLVGGSSKEYIYSNEKTKEGLDNEATAVVNEKGMKLVNGNVLTVGIPELMPGKYTKIKAAENLDKMYYIKNVIHKLDENGYTTLVNLGGNTI